MRRGMVVLLVAWAWLGVHTRLLAGWTVDDAFVTYRYARNVVAGHGPVWNPGEPVEGYTSALWLVVLSAAHALGADLPSAGRWLGLGFAALTPALLLLAPRATAIGPTGVAVAIGLTGTSTVLSAWAGGGLEVPLLTALAVVSWLVSVRDRDDLGHGVAIGLLGAALVACRPDAALIPAVQLADLLLRRRWRSAAALAVAAAAVLVPHEAWRLAYYGWPLPNTFYAKVGTRLEQLQRGWTYLAGASVHVACVGLPLLAAVKLGLPGWARAPLGWVALHLAYVLAVGGDGLPAWRFVAVVIPVLALVAGAVAERAPRILVPLAGAAALAELGWGQVDRELVRIGDDHVAAAGEEVGRWLAEHEPPGTLVATNAAGALPFFSQLPTVDMLGLCDAHVAHAPMAPGVHKAGHEKADGPYVLSRRPDLVLFGASRGREKPFFVSDQALWALPEFREGYAMERHRLPSGASLVVWRRR